MTERLYHADSYLTSFYADVVRSRSLADGVAAVLSRTAFFPTSGGQPHDVGTLDGAQVIDVREEGEDLIHIVTHPVAGRVHGMIDWPRRFDHMQQHSGQHVLSQAALQVLDAATRAVHFGEETATLDLDRADLTRPQAASLEDLANRVVFEDRPVHVRQVDESELPALGLRRPPKQSGLIRVVEIEQFDRSACGGTHVRRTGEIGCITIRRWERHRGGVRVEFLCGWRALREARRKSTVLGDLSAALTVADREVPDALARMAAQLRAHERTIEEMRDRLLERDAADMLRAADTLGGTDGGPTLVATTVAHGGDEAARLAGRLTADRLSIALIGASDGRLILARSAGVSLDAAAALRTIVEHVGGRGGGRPEFAQGAVPPDQLSGAIAFGRSLLTRLFEGSGG